MKKILVPLDFSKCSAKALDYAVSLAKRINARIILLHADQTSFIPAETPYEFIAGQIRKEEQNSVNKLKRLAAKVNLKSKVKCSYFCSQGSPVDSILESAVNEKPDWIVMGTKGASGINEMLLGSNTAKVIAKTAYPVIVVPEGAAPGKINKIVYATDYHLNDLNALRHLVKLAQLFGAAIDVVHVTDGEHQINKENDLLADFKKSTGRKITYKKISYHLAFGKSIEKTLDKFVKGQSADLLALSTHHRNLFDQLFGSSISKTIIYHSKIPLLAFHYRKDPVIFT